MCGGDCLLAILAIIFPPIAVWVKRGICSADSFINIALCFLGFLPGLIHAWYIISVTPEPTYEQIPDTEGGRTTTYVVVQGGQGGGYQRQAASQPKYGTVNSTADSQFPGQRNGFVQPPQASSSAGEVAPPTYQDAVGDHKVQTR
ncbi:hypothetical protein AMS68_004695 [Peltaster fructicola]|uniref:Stress response RCI peptide n=1 Tax=Peltaster fructicola TaxID=286661 RepID=A0A6H0XX53_9PEZI|nr:hypothetical protein AMS68_004695 [Peltaster fructicola]